MASSPYGLISIRAVLPAALGFLFLLGTFPPSAWSGTPENPEISDRRGDVNPVAWILQVPPSNVNLATVNHLEFADLLQTYVASEDRASLRLHFKLADVPYDWILDEGGPGAPPIPPVNSSVRNITWSDPPIQNKINLTAYFKVRGQSYQATATLAEVYLDNPNPVPRVDTRVLVRVVAGAALDALQEAEPLLPPLGTLNETESVGQEIHEAFQDARDALEESKDAVEELPPPITGAQKEYLMQRLTTAQEKLTYLESLIPQFDSVDLDGTLRQAITKARENATKAQTLLPWAATGCGTPVGQPQPNSGPGDLPGGTQPTHPTGTMSTPPTSMTSGSPTTTSSNVPSNPCDRTGTADPPHVYVYHRFTLLDSNRTVTPLQGSIDPETNTVQLRIPKNRIGLPHLGETLQDFRSASFLETKFALDYAPDPANPSPSDSVNSLLHRARAGQLVKPTYGANYAFAYGSPGDPYQVKLNVKAVGEVAKSLVPGGTVTYKIELQNKGEGELDGTFDLSTPRAGWSQRTSTTLWYLGPGQKDEFVLTVGALAGAPLDLVTNLTVGVQGGDPQFLQFHTTLLPEASPPMPEAPVPTQVGTVKRIGGTQPTGAGAAMVTLGGGVLVVVAVAGGLVAFFGRRKG